MEVGSCNIAQSLPFFKIVEIREKCTCKMSDVAARDLVIQQSAVGLDFKPQGR